MPQNKAKIVVCVGCVAFGIFIGTSLSKMIRRVEEIRSKTSTQVFLKNCLSKIENDFLTISKNTASKIYVIKSLKDFATSLPHIIKDVNEVPLLGFDCEWVSGKPVSILQLATYNGHVLIIQLNNIIELPDILVNVLENPSIIKLGVSCIHDANKLKNGRSITVNGCFDLRFLANIEPFDTKRGLSLKALAEKYLNVKMSKPRSIQCSNWDSTVLSSNQIKYAAEDASIAVQIFVAALFKKFSNRASAVTKSLELTVHKELWQMMIEQCHNNIDVQFLQPKKSVKSRESNLTKKSNTKPPKNLLTKKHLVRSRPIYSNCRLQAPDGALLCTCGRKRADWYVKKGLATIICQDPFTIQLKFEPSGRNSEGHFDAEEKLNICVVCGTEENILRKNIVPHEYRKYFPVPIKGHVSHDVLPLCLSCHYKSNRTEVPLREQIAVQFNAPIHTEAWIQVPDIKKVQSAATALSRSYSNLPLQRRDELQQIIMDYFDTSEMNQSLIEKAMNLSIKVQNPHFKPHGEAVVESLMKGNALQRIYDFECLWRKHFVNSMKPKFLPIRWSINFQRPKYPPTTESNQLLEASSFKEDLSSAIDRSAAHSGGDNFTPNSEGACVKDTIFEDKSVEEAANIEEKSESLKNSEEISTVTSSNPQKTFNRSENQSIQSVEANQILVRPFSHQKSLEQMPVETSSSS